MANVISDETIEYVGILAKLELSDEEMCSLLIMYSVRMLLLMVTEARQLLLMHLNVMNQDLLYLKLLNHRKDAYEFIRLYSC